MTNLKIGGCERMFWSLAWFLEFPPEEKRVEDNVCEFPTEQSLQLIRF